MADPTDRPVGHYLTSTSCWDHHTANLGGPKPAYLTVHIGTDSLSSGVSVWAYEPSGGEFPHVHVLMAKRWAQQPESVSELCSLVARAMAQIAEEQGW